MVWFQGKHTVRSGFDLRRLQNIFDNSGFSRGMVVSGDIGEFTSDSETCVTCSRAAFCQSFVRLRDQTTQSLQTHVSLVRDRDVSPGHMAGKAEPDNQPGTSLRVLFTTVGDEPSALELRLSCQRTGPARHDPGTRSLRQSSVERGHTSQMVFDLPGPGRASCLGTAAPTATETSWWPTQPTSNRELVLRGPLPAAIPWFAPDLESSTTRFPPA